ncbi:MAG TPA: hypothetical protein VE089_01820 [Nitrososphaeraceae archaeon]|nr:hypothetical protein [Nitrososphaeraceae archaeon]
MRVKIICYQYFKVLVMRYKRILATRTTQQEETITMMISFVQNELNLVFNQWMKEYIL